MHVYEFSWVPLNWKANKDQDVNGLVFVQTTDKRLMDLFLLQHGFDPNTKNVKVTDDESYRDDDSISLHLYTFGSKKRDRLYHIATTEDLMNEVISSISYTLADAMSFGTCALHGEEIELFARVQSLVEVLDYVYIRETNPMFQENSVDDCYRYIAHPHRYEELSRDDDIDALCDELYNETKPDPNEPVPFTIEAYLSVFTREFLLGREVKVHGKKDNATG